MPLPDWPCFMASWTFANVLFPSLSLQPQPAPDCPGDNHRFPVSKSSPALGRSELRRVSFCPGSESLKSLTSGFNFGGTLLFGGQLPRSTQYKQWAQKLPLFFAFPHTPCPLVTSPAPHCPWVSLYLSPPADQFLLK